MSTLRPAAKLTRRGAMAVLEAALAAAERLSIPQCIAIVDEGTNLLAFCRMAGSRVLSVESATRKAMTAASTGLPTGNLPEEKALLLVEATSGRMTNLPGGLPLMVDGMVVGAIGVGSGTGDQDVEIARIGVAAFEKLLGEDDQR
jgi:uncharacterized protein GlcG (DUF336 family)